MVTGSGPSLRTDSCMPDEPRIARSITSRSTGGTPSCWTTPAAPDRIRMKSKPARSARGTTANIQTRASGTGSVTASCVTADPARFEQAHPPELGEFALMGVEHEAARIAEARLENGALALTQHQRVGRFTRRQRGAGAVGVE